MTAGQLDRRIEIIRVTATADDWGQQVATETVLATVWSQFIQESAKESFQNGTVAGNITAIFRLRWREGITAGQHRVRFQNRDWNIVECREIGRRQGLDLHATAIT